MFQYTVELHMDSTRLHIDSGSSRFRFFHFFRFLLALRCWEFCLCAVCSLIGREKLPLMYVFLFFEKKNTKINLLIYMSSYMDASLCDVHVCLWCLAVTSFLGQTKRRYLKGFFGFLLFFRRPHMDLVKCKLWSLFGFYIILSFDPFSEALSRVHL